VILIVEIVYLDERRVDSQKRKENRESKQTNKQTRSFVESSLTSFR